MVEQFDGLAAESVPPGISASASPTAHTADPAPRRNATVLLVTARRPLVNWFQFALATAGLSLTMSPDGLHAMMSAVRQPPELVILDDDLPGVEAERVEKMLARDARTARTRIVHVKFPDNARE